MHWPALHSFVLDAHCVLSGLFDTAYTKIQSIKRADRGKMIVTYRARASSRIAVRRIDTIATSITLHSTSLGCAVRIAARTIARCQLSGMIGTVDKYDDTMAITRCDVVVLQVNKRKQIHTSRWFRACTCNWSKLIQQQTHCSRNQHWHTSMHLLKKARKLKN